MLDRSSNQSMHRSTMSNIRRIRLLVAWVSAALLLSGCGRGKDPAAESPAEPAAQRAVDWLRPSDEHAEPVWGIKGGVAIGLWPMRGPRGLFRIYAPYLGQPPGRPVNFISIEPVVKGVRGQSELEVGGQSGRTGLAMWSGDTQAEAASPRDPASPARGRVEKAGDAETLTFYVATEPFRNGARPIVQIVLRADRPHEVGFRLFAPEGSATLDACVLSATMGNYGRLRRLWLYGEVVDARKVWPRFEPDPLGFAPWHAWGRDRLVRQDGALFVAATSDETDLTRAAYDPAVAPHWHYEGKPATHTWRTADVAGVVARVNGRATYWGGNAPIPGGVAYENFELEAPFAAGQEFTFGVTPAEPTELGFDRAWQRKVTDGK
jgi:hypothetical protein